MKTKQNLIMKITSLLLVIFLAFGNVAQASAIFSSTVAETTRQVTVIEKDFDASTEVPRSNQIQGAYDWYVDAVNGSDGNDGSEGSPFKTIQKAITTATEGQSVFVANGTYPETLYITRGVHITGESRDGVIIDTSAWGGYGIDADGDFVTSFENFTLIGPGSSQGYGLKIAGDNAKTTIENVLVKNSFRTGIDLNGLNEAVVTDVVVENNGGNGFAMTNCNNVTITNITTSGNAWGGVALYTSTGVNTPGSDGVSIVGTNSFGEPTAFYTQIHPDYPPTNLNVPDFAYMVTNATDKPNVTVFAADLDRAGAIANGMTTPEDSVIRKIATSELIVVPGLTIQAAIDAANPGDTVLVMNGSYQETLHINKNIHISGESRDGVIIDTSASTVYGVHAYGDIETSFANLTIIGPASAPGSYGLKIAGENAETTITNVLVKNSARTGLDLNGLNGAVITDVVLQNNAGNGLSLTNSSNVTVTNITTSGNTWGGVAVYTDSTSYSQGADNISITGTNSSNEPVGFYTEIDPDYPPTNLNVPEFHFTVVNNTDRLNYTFYAKDQAYALLIATYMPHPEDSYIRDIATSNLLVFPGMTIQAAVDAANPGDTVLVAAGTYEENVYTGDTRIIKGLTVRGIPDADGNNPLVKGSMKFGRDRSLGGDYAQKNLVFENFRIEANLTDTALFGTTRHALWVENFENAQLRNLELVGTEPNSMLAIQYGLSVGGRAKDYTIDNVTIENFELGVHGRSLNMTITNADISHVDSGVNIMGGGNLTITASSIVPEVTTNTGNIYAVRFGEGNVPGDPDVRDLHISNSTLRLNNPGNLTPIDGKYMRSLVLRGNAGGELDISNSNIPQGILNIASVPIEATGNWWGSANQPVPHVNYVGLVNICGWLDAPAPDGQMISGGVVTNQTTSQTYCSIQAAIDDATAGDVLVASAGTFVEQIVIDKAITLRGPNYEKTGFAADRLPEAIVTYPSGIPEDGSMALVEVEADGVTIEGFTFQSVTEYPGRFSTHIHTYSANNFTVRNNIINGTEIGIYRDPYKTGYTFTDNSGWLVEGNLIDGGLNRYVNSRVGRGIYIYRATAIVRDNKIINHNTGIQILPATLVEGGVVENNIITAGQTGLYHNGAEKGSGAWTYRANTISVAPNDRSAQDVCIPYPPDLDVGFRAIHVINQGLGTTGELPAVTFTQNIADMTRDAGSLLVETVAVRISESNPLNVKTPIMVNENHFSNYTIAVNNTTDNNLDASYNYWGTIDATELFNKITPGSDYTPWLASGTDMDADLAGFQGDFSTLYVDDDSFQIGTVGRIQEAVNLVSGSTIYVLPGTYAEQVVIDKALTIQGPNFDKAGYAADRGAEATVTFPAGITALDERLVRIEADDVTILGMNFVQADYMLALRPQLMRLYGVSNITIRNNRFYGTEMGIGTTPSTDTTVSHSGLLVEGNYINGGPYVNSRYNRGMYIYRMGGLIQNNVIEHVATGIQFLPHREPSGLTAQYNAIEAYGIGLYHNNHYADSGEFKWIGNTVTVAENLRGTAEMDVNLPFDTDIYHRAIHITHLGLSGGSEAPVAEFYNNVFDGSYDAGLTKGLLGSKAVYVSTATSGTAVEGSLAIVKDNSFENFTTYIDNETTGTTREVLVNASGNWWGTTDAAALLAGVTAGSDYTPWLASGTDIDAVADGFQGDFSTLYVDDDSFQIGTVCRIQEAIDLVSGSTIYVMPGTYEEAVVVNKAVNLYGPNMDVDPNGTVARGAEAIILGSTTAPEMSTLFELDAENVVVKGFTFDNVRINNYIDGGATGALTNQFGGVDISNNIFTNVSGTAVYLRDGRNAPGEYSADVIVQNNLFNAISSAGGVDYNAGSAVIVMGAENLLVDGNVIVSAAYNGIQLARNNNVTVSNNTALAAQPAIQIAQWNEGTQTISGNDLQTSHASKAAMRFYAFTTDRTPSFVIENNEIHDSVNGIQIGHGDAGKGDDISTADYSFAGNTFTSISGHELVVYLPAEATTNQMTEMLEDFRQVYDQNAYVCEINGVDPYTYVLNYMPVAVDDAYTVAEDNELIVLPAEGVLVNDTDGDNDVLSAIRVTDPANGTLTLNEDGSFTYTPNLNYFGSDSFTYKVSDGYMDSNIATVTITVTPVKDPVQAVDDFYSVNQNAVLEVSAPGVLGNDIDVDLNNQFSALVSGPSNGNLIFRNNGSFTYTPKPGFFGTDTFVYQLITTPKTQDLWTDTATVTITVIPLPVISSPDIAGPYMVGELREFNVTLTNPAEGASYSSMSASVFVDNITFDDFETVEVYHPVYHTWVPLTPVVDGDGLRLDLGPTANFPLSPGQVVTLTFRVEFNTAKEYEATGSLYCHDSGTAVEIASFADTMVVYAWPVISSQDLAGPYFVGELREFNVTLTNPANGASYTSMSASVFVDDIEPDDFETVEVYHPVSHTWVPLTPVVEDNGLRLDLGPTANFPLLPGQVVTLTFRVKFNTTGDYTATGTLYCHDSGAAVEMASFTGTMMVKARPVVSSADIEGPYTVGVRRDFHVTLTNPADGATYTNLSVSVFVDNITFDDFEKVEVLHPVYGTWVELTPVVDGDGLRLDLGPTGQFPLVPGQIYTLTFRVTFKTAGTYPAEGSLYDTSGATPVEIASYSTTLIVNNPPNTLPEQIASAPTYVYDPVYEYVGDFVYDAASLTYTATYTAPEYLAGGAMNDLARYLGALYRQDGSTINKLTYKGVDYTWQPGTPPLAGSNWKDENGVTLVSVIVADLANQVPGNLTVTVADNFYTEDVSFVVNVTNTLDDEIKTAPTYVYDPVYNYVGTFTFDDPSNTYTATYTDVNYNPGALYDLARYLGALYRQANATVIGIHYNGVDYTWNPNGTNKGSNWEDAAGTTLVSVVGADFQNGLIDPDVTFTVSDGIHTETVTFVIVINDTTAPEVVSITAIGAEGFGDVVAVGNVITVDQGYTVERTEIVLNEAVTVEAGTVVSIGTTPYGTITADGTKLTVVPYAGNGVASLPGTFAFSVPAGSVKDLAGNALVQLGVSLVVNNVAPVAVADAYTTNQDVALNVDAPGVLANDNDWTPITAVLVTDVSHGELTLNADGSFSYTPAAGYNGTDSFSYKANDGTADSEVVTVTITVVDNVAPEVVSVTAIGADGFGDVLAVGSVITVDQGYTVARTEIVLNEAVTVEPGTVVSIHGQPYGSITANGSLLTVTPYGSNGIASLPGTFVLSIPAGSVKDLAGNALPNANVTLVVNNVAPVAVADAYTTNQDVVLNVGAPGVLENDFDWTPITAVLVTNVSHGNLTLNANGSFSYTPAAGYNGTDSFSYKAYDGKLYSDVTTVTITVVDNVAPEVVSVTAIGADGFGDVVAVGSTLTVDQGYTVSRTEIVLNEAVTVEAGTEVSIGGQPYGSITANGTKLTVVPYAGNEIASLPGTFAFSVPAGSVKDLAGNALLDLVVTLTVNNVAPVANDDAYTTEEDTLLTVAVPGVLANDVDWTPLTITLVSDVSNGTLTLNANGSFTYMPDDNWHGTDNFTYKVSDGELESGVATVTITVTPVKDQVNAVDDFYTVNENAVLNIAAPGVMSNDLDPDGNQRRVVLVTDVAHGTLKLNADGSFVYTPEEDWSGEDSFVYELITYPKTQGLWTDEATVTITVIPMPIISSDDVAGPYFVGKQQEFHVTLTNPVGGATYTSMSASIFVDNIGFTDFESVEVKHPVTGDWIGLTPVVDGNGLRLVVGPTSNYAVGPGESVTLTFRGTFNTPGNYTGTGTLYCHDSGAAVEIGSLTATMVVYARPVISSDDVAGPYYVGEQREFHVTLDNTDGTTYTSMSASIFVDNIGMDDFDSVEVKHPVTGQWIALTPVVEGTGLKLVVGPTSNYAVGPNESVTLTFRVEFNTANSYPVTGILYCHDSGTTVEIGRLTDTAIVYARPVISSDDLAGPYHVGALGSFSVTLSNPADGDSYDNLSASIVIEGIGLEDFTSIEIKHPINGNWITLSPVEQGENIVLNIPMTDAFAIVPGTVWTLEFRGTFKTAGNYPASGILYCHDSGAPVVIGTLNDTMEVKPASPVITSNDLAGPYFVSEPGSFSVTMTNPADGGTYLELSALIVIEGIGLDDFTSIEVKHPVSGAWIVLSPEEQGDNVVLDIPVTDAFAITPGKIWTLEFRGEFLTPGSYVASGILYSHDGGEAIEIGSLTDTMVVYARPVISSTDLAGPYFVGELQEFHVTLDNTDGTTYTSMSASIFVDNIGLADFAVAEVKHPVTGQWITLTPVVEGTGLKLVVGPTSNYAVGPDDIVTLTFRLEFNTAGSYTGTGTLYCHDSGTAVEIGSLTDTMVVYARPVISSDDIAGPYFVGELQEFHVTLDNTDGTTYTSMSASIFVDNIGLADFAVAEVKHPVTGQWIGLTPVVEGSGLKLVVGPTSNYAVGPDATVTLTFRVEFNTAGEYEATGVFTWIPVESQVGVHVFDICVSDGELEDCQEIKVTVLEGDVNTAPVARPDAYEVDFEGVLSVAAPGVLANDTDADGDELTAILVSTTANGTLTFNSDGSFLYIPRAGFSGTDTFRYKANDGELDSNIVTVTITVKAAPPQPVYRLWLPIIKK